MFDDTIFAVASPPGPGERAVLRLSGPQALAAAALVFAPRLPRERAQRDGEVAVDAGSFPAFALVMPGPRSFTGEDVVELHVPGSALLCTLLGERLAAAGRALGVRQARPGEFTARAFRNGRLDAAQAEGVLLLIHGADAAATAQGAAWLAGGLSAAVASVRGHLQDALAWLETGLDFGVEDGAPADALALGGDEWRQPASAAARELGDLCAALPAAVAGGEVLLLGASNAGKSSLANALAGRDAVLVADEPGTTRDVVRVEIAPGAAVWDAPGDLDEPSATDRAALLLRDRLGGQAAAALLVVDPARPRWPVTALPVLGVAFAKQDLGPLPAAVRAQAPGGAPVFAVSSVSGEGIAELRAFLAAQSQSGARDPGGPVRAAASAAARAVAAALRAPADAPAEVLGVELQAALAGLSAVCGSHGAEDVLERIYARFCLGK